MLCQGLDGPLPPAAGGDLAADVVADLPVQVDQLLAVGPDGAAACRLHRDAASISVSNPTPPLSTRPPQTARERRPPGSPPPPPGPSRHGGPASPPRGCPSTANARPPPPSPAASHSPTGLRARTPSK